MKRSWNQQTVPERILSILKIIVSITILSASILKLFHVWPKGLNLAIPLFAVYYILETICSWKTNRDWAATSLFLAIIIAGISCAVFFL